MVTMRRLAAATLIGSVALISASCSSGDDTAAADELRGKVAGQFQTVLDIDNEQADCVAGEMIDIYGSDEMQQFVDDPDNYAPAEEASPEVTQKALEDCGIDPMELVRDRSLEGDTGEIPAEGSPEPSVGASTDGTTEP